MSREQVLAGFFYPAFQLGLLLFQIHGMAELLVELIKTFFSLVILFVARLYRVAPGNERLILIDA
ncbi:hypothetical protein ES703_44862 [subsurface metagenome]